ncbi:putative peroxisomal acyl-coenzyme A oxidase 1 [Papilio machaon]|uniref:Acyl-coenzyme A oxidase n=1 Tax=Papilio machaon TaxID=76193 RepID=A0A194QVD7_PAPMA|nr:putative peroxisomal acyl-coenzyme A oxidase 1 [Papilio machaon]
MSEVNINEDLVKERKKCTFDVEELIHLVDGGKHNTLERKKVEQYVLSIKELKDDVPEEYLSHKERYENSVRKGSILFMVLMKGILERKRNKDEGISYNYKIINGVVKDVTPFMLHFGMFLPTLASQASPEQQREWLKKGSQMIGTYAQTELGHGTFLRGLETTATYDADTEEFIIHSPNLTSYKWWPGGLAQTVNHCIVMAQLYIKGKNHGIHPFLVQIRDIETHMPLPGIKVGDIGPKLGFQTANNGFLGFDNYRIPRMNMLMKNSQVLKDGTYVKAKNDKLTYGTMVFVRVTIVADVAYELARAATIAVRYAAVRHQSKPKPNEPEPQILDYLTQQHKLFIAVSTSHAFRIVGRWLWSTYTKPEPQILDYVTQQHKLFIAVSTSHAFRIVGRWLWSTYTKVVADIRHGNMDHLPELHALACCLKAVCSKDASVCVEQCRFACGGHGYMQSSNLPIIYGIVTATVTYEGEHTVMLLQTARYLVKAYKQASEGKSLTPTVAYMAKYLKNGSHCWQNTPEGIIGGFQAVAAGKTKEACESLFRHAHARAVLCEMFWKEIQRISSTVSPSLAIVLEQLAELYLKYWALEKRGDMLMYSNITKEDISSLQRRYVELLALIRPNAVGIVDAFDIRDEILCSTLGAYDGRVYERLMEEAMKSPLNKEPVNQSFHKYIKPLLIQAKL